MYIKVISHKASAFPLSLGNPQAFLHSDLPKQVSEIIQQVRHWYVVLWRDESMGLAGIKYRNSIQIIDLKHLKSATISFMKRAKGDGFVAFELTMEHHLGYQTVFESPFFNPIALEWLITHQHEFEELLGCEIMVCDRGFDC